MNLDNIFSKAKEVFESAYKKTGDVVAAGKHKLDISALESKLTKDFETLGRIYYDAVLKDGGVQVANTEPIISEISKKTAQIEELKKNPPKDHEKNKLCPNCGQKAEKDSAFCRSCGTKLD